MMRTSERVLRRWSAVALFAAAACSPPSASVPAPEPIPLADSAAGAVASLIAAEDQRRFDPSLFRRLSGYPHPEVRRQMALAVGRLRDPAGIPLLNHLLSDADTAVAATAAFALGQIGDSAAVDAVSQQVQELAEERWTVAAEAATALGKLQTPAAHRALIALLSDPRAADEALHPAVHTALLAIWKHPRGTDRPGIQRWLANPNSETRWRAAYALVRRPDPAAVPDLLELASDPDAQVRSTALRGLRAPLVDSAGVSREPVLAALSEAAGDTSYPVRVNAIRTLGSYATPEAVGTVAPLLGSADRMVAFTAAEVLGAMGPAAQAAAASLEEIAADTSTHPALRGAARVALARSGSSRTAGLAARFAREPNWRLRAAAGQAYAAMSPPPRDPLTALVRDPDGRVAAAALSAALDVAGNSVGPLRPLLLESLGASDVMVRAAAARGLARLADPTTLPVLLDAYGQTRNDPEPDAALALLDALDALARGGVPIAHLLARRFPPAEHLQVRQKAAAILGDSIATAPVADALDSLAARALVEHYLVPHFAGTENPRLLIETPQGPIEIELFAADAPRTVDNIVRLANAGFFDGQQWPRVVPNFVVQGGDPRGDTNGGPGYSIRDEINRHPYGRGTVGMALAGPDTGGSQFFITHSPQPHLDGSYTVFGRVISGMEAAEHILPGDPILRISVLPCASCSPL